MKQTLKYIAFILILPLIWIQLALLKIAYRPKTMRQLKDFYWYKGTDKDKEQLVFEASRRGGEFS